MTLEVHTVPVCNRCGTANDPEGKNICERCHGAVEYSQFPKRVVVRR